MPNNMNEFKHACFISYRNGSVVEGEPVPDLLNEFARCLKDALTSEFRAMLTPHLDEPVFLDVDNLLPADRIEAKIANALCHSACMVLVYTPNYFDERKTFCAREYLAMKKREAYCTHLKGEHDTNKSLIFTLILRGSADKIPAELEESVYENFNFFYPKTRIEHTRNYKDKIKVIANEIAKLYSNFIQYENTHQVKFCEVCADFELPTTSEEGENIETFITLMKAQDTPNYPST